MVLASLILVAGVANLNLSVANVALPDIGKHFDSSQTTLNLIAVGYSLGLAASVLYLGALGDRYGRKLMLLLGMALSVPACLLAAFAPSDDVLFGARVLGGVSAGMAYPTTLALITALWSGPGAPGRSRCGRRSAARSRRSARRRRRAARAVRLGLGVPHNAAARASWPSRWPRARARHVNESTEAVDNLGGVLSIVLVGGADPRHQLRRRCRTRATLALGAGGDRAGRGWSPSSCASAARANPLYDLHVAGAPRLLGRGLRGDHRLRLADGRRVHQPAVPAERARLLDARAPAPRSCPRSSSWCWSRRARPSSSRRAARASRCSAATCSCCSPSRRCCCCGRRTSRTGRSASPTCSSASASGSPARRPRTR